MPPKFERSSPSDYEILRLPPHASLADLKKAYRELVKQWHPDRFQQDSIWERRVAEEKFKEITAAYQRILSEWSEDASEDGRRKQDDRETYRPVHEKKSAAAAPVDQRESAEERARGNPLQPFFQKLRFLYFTWRRSSFSVHFFVGGALIALFLLLNLYWWVGAPHRVSGPSKGPRAINPPRPPADFLESKDPSPLLESKGEGSSAGLLESSASPAGNALRHRPYFTLGSSSEEVRRAQGSPSNVKGNTWSYGLSEVQFKDNRVVRYNNFDGSLKVRLLPSGASGEKPLPFITIGATKDDVLRILGTPTRVSGNRWYYGFSEIRFKEERLIGYDNFFEHFAIHVAPSDPAASSAPKESFTIGSTQDDVLAAQGTPTSIQGNLWFYRSSNVLFRDGRVQGVSDLEGNLRFAAPEEAPDH